MPSFRLKRGNSEKVNQYVGNAGELIYNTETNKVVVMDGVNAGGVALGGSEVLDVENPPAFQKVLGSTALTANVSGNKLGWYQGEHTLAIQENQDTIYWVANRNATYDTDGSLGTNAIYSVSKSDLNSWLATVENVTGFSSPPISDLPSYKVFSGADWWTWMDNNGGRGSTSITKRHPFIFIDKQSTGANPVAYLVFIEEKRPGNSSKDGRTFIATGSNLENLQELLIPTINNQKSGHPALVDANAGGAFDNDQTAPTSNGYADMDANFWGSTTGPTFVTANSTHIFVMIQWWGINVYLKDGTYVKSLKHPILGWYNSGWGWGYLDSRQTYPAAGMFCTDDRLVIVTAEDGMAWNYYQNMNATYRDAAQGTLEAAQFDMFWGEIAVYSGDGTYLTTFKNPMPRQNGEYNYFANAPFNSMNFLSNNILTVYNTESQIMENGFGATAGVADGATSFEEGAVHIYDMNTLTKINTVYNTTHPDIVGWTWTWAYKQSPGPRAIPDGTNDCILIIATDGKDTWEAVRGSTGEVLDTITNVPDDPENDYWGIGSTYATGSGGIRFGGTSLQLADKTVVMSHVPSNLPGRPPTATFFKLAGELSSKLKLADNKFLKLPTDSSYELDITKTKLSDFTNDAGFATTAQIPTVPTALSSFTNDVGFVNSAGSAVTTQIYNETTAASGVGFGAQFNCISHTFTNIPAGATILVTVQGTLQWSNKTQAYPAQAAIVFRPGGAHDVTWRFDVRSEDQNNFGSCSQGFSFTYKPYVVTNGGNFLMQVEVVNYSHWTCTSAFGSLYPVSLIATIIG